MFNATVVDIKKLAESNQDAIAAKHGRRGEGSVECDPFVKAVNES